MHSFRAHRFILAFAPAGSAQISLGSAASYGLLSGYGINNQGTSAVKGNIGVYPENTVNGFPPGLLTGIENAGNAAAASARNDARTAFNQAHSLGCSADMTGQYLEGTFAPGVYCFLTEMELTGKVTLDGQGNPDSQFVFKIAGDLTTNASSEVVLVNGARACGVIYAINSYSVRRLGTIVTEAGTANLGQGSKICGNVLAGSSVIIDSEVSVLGGIYSLDGTINVNYDQISQPGSCGTTLNSSSITTVPSKISPVTTSSVIKPTCKPHRRPCIGD